MQGNSSCSTCLNLERSYPAPLFPEALGSPVCMFVRVKGGLCLPACLYVQLQELFATDYKEKM